MKRQSERERSNRKVNAMDMQVSQRLRVLRHCSGMSQAELGNLVGLSFQQIQKYENGSNRVCAGRLMQIAQALDVPVALFFEDLVPEDRPDLDVEGLVRLPVSPSTGGRPERVLPVGHVASMIADYNAIDDRPIQQSIARLIRSCAQRDRRFGPDSSNRDTQKRRKASSAGLGNVPVGKSAG